MIVGAIVVVLLVVTGGVVAVRALNRPGRDPIVALPSPGATSGSTSGGTTGTDGSADASPSPGTGEASGDPSASPEPLSANGSAEVRADTGTAPRKAAQDVLVIASDLPLQGSAGDASREANEAMEQYLESIGHRAGRWRLRLRTYDDSTPAQGAWDERTCVANARRHVQRTQEVAVVGTFNSGCTKLQLPVLNKAPGGPMLMVSHANSNPGLTTTWLPGEPGVYYPTGLRNYARVIARDDQQGAAVAEYAVEGFRAKACAVLDDGTTYGKGVADAFAVRAKAIGLRVVARKAWEAGTTNYRTLFTFVKAKKPDCVFLGGIADSDGAAVVAAKVAVLGPNSAVPLLAPDGFAGYPEIDALPAAQGMFVSFPGVDAEQLRQRSGAGSFLDRFSTSSGSRLSSYSLYAVAALQVVVAAIEASSGSRTGIREAVLGAGKGVSIAASDSAIGTQIAIEPATGDVTESEVTILRIASQQEELVTVRTVSPA